MVGCMVVGLMIMMIENNISTNSSLPFLVHDNLFDF